MAAWAAEVLHHGRATDTPIGEKQGVFLPSFLLSADPIHYVEAPIAADISKKILCTCAPQVLSIYGNRHCSFLGLKEA
jgi:hypothetical protein